MYNTEWIHSHPFVKSKRILNIIAMSEQYRTRPSELLGLCDSYTAFCFDEACYFIRTKLQDLKKEQIERLNFIENAVENEKKNKPTRKHYKSYSELVKEVTGK